MNVIQKAIIRNLMKRKMKQLNIPIPRGADLLKIAEQGMASAKAKQAEEKTKEFDSLMTTLPFEGYEVVATCDACSWTDVVACVPDERQALELAKQASIMRMDDENVVHNHRAGVTHVTRELSYSPEDVSRAQQEDNL